MILYPAIDLLNQRVVRLHKGEFDAVTDYGDDPIAVAKGFAQAGADWVHVVDLSGARDGQRNQSDIIGKICATGIRVQTGGGVRSKVDVEALLGLGVARIIVGSMAVIQPDQVSDWIRTFGPERICLALDVREEDGIYKPAIKGWSEGSGRGLDGVLAGFDAVVMRHCLVTDINRDGDLSGPNLDLYADLVARYPKIEWQASGGISSLDDIRAVKKLGMAGAISGKAIYEGRFSLEEALACSQSG